MNTITCQTTGQHLYIGGICADCHRSRAADEALANLWEQDWFAQDTKRPEVEEVKGGGYTVWCESEIYRIAADGEIFRIHTRSGERVII